MSNYQKPHTLERDVLGRLMFIDAAGTSHLGVYPVRAFPITEPDAGISIMDQSGKELCWFNGVTAIPEAELALIEEELAAREFMPVIEKLLGYPLLPPRVFGILKLTGAQLEFASRVRKIFAELLAIRF